MMQLDFFEEAQPVVFEQEHARDEKQQHTKSEKQLEMWG